MKRARVLIGEDDEGACGVLCDLLEPEYDVVGVVRDGRAALESARDHCPDLVLLDIGLPLVRGVAVARALKRTMPLVRIIFVTVHSDPAYVREALRIGVDGFLLKSRVAVDLIPAVRQVLDGRAYHPLIQNSEADFRNHFGC